MTKSKHFALLGKTGCGKSTLLQLLTRAWDVDSGSITLNGHPINEFSEQALRSVMSVVPQRVHVFSDTLRNNLLLAKEQATDAELNEVLRQVGLGNLLENELKLNAWMGDGETPIIWRGTTPLRDCSGTITQYSIGPYG